MRVAIVGPDKPVGGISAHVRGLAEGLRSTGDEVVIVPERGGGPASSLYYLKQFTGEFDVVHVQGLQYFEPLTSALIARRLVGPRSIATAHGFGQSKWWFNGAERRFMRYVVRKFDRLISVSEYVKRRLQNFTGLPSSRIVTVYNGVDTRVFNPNVDGTEFKRRIGLEGSFMILYVGRWARTKGLPDLINCLPEVIKSVPNAKLVLCGRGKMEQALRGQVTSMGLQEGVRFVKLVPSGDLPLYYAASDLFVLPSSHEPFGLVLLEAMSMCKPVIATRVGGIPEVVKDGENGLLVPPHDAKSLSNAVLRLEADEPLRSRLARNGRATVESQFTLERMAQATRRCYEASTMR
ncbi:MAG: glycosyltransferase family 4 protein [Nitrososphaerales archaeon]